jgi:hypothetical protein
MRHSLPIGLRFNLGTTALPVEIDIEPHKIVKWMQNLRDDPWYEIELVPYSGKDFLDWVGLSVHTVVAATRGVGDGGGEVTGRTIIALGQAMDAIESGQVAFFRRYRRAQNAKGRSYQRIDDRLVGTAMLRFTRPVEAPGLQPSLLPREYYVRWAACKSCGGRRYAAIKLGETERYAACWDCHPSRTYRTFCAEAMRPRLVVDLATKEYPLPQGEVWR